ncbi:hypothetical protein [Kitasatospora sp. NPDC054795]
MLGRGDGGDRWLVVDAADGRVIAEYALPTVGQGAHQVAHPDGTELCRFAVERLEKLQSSVTSHAPLTDWVS